MIVTSKKIFLFCYIKRNFSSIIVRSSSILFSLSYNNNKLINFEMKKYFTIQESAELS